LPGRRPFSTKLENLAKKWIQKIGIARALEYERLAQDTLDPIAQKTYRDMARQRRELAEQAASDAPGPPMTLSNMRELGVAFVP
jgi:hypothetical protein